MRRCQPSSVSGRTRNTDQRPWQQPAQRRQQRTVTGLQAGPRVLAAQDHKLVADYQDLDLLGVRPSDLHAGWAETSILLHLHPGLVRLHRAAPGGPAHGAGLVDGLRRVGVRAVSTSGVLGDPAGASATDGEALLRRLGDDLARAVERSFPP